MDATSRPRPKRRPVYLDLPAIRMPVPAIASILHRVSGALLFFIGIPAVLWSVQAGLQSPDSYATFRTFIAHPLVKSIALVLLWAYLHHTFAGVRHLLQDVHVGLELKSARASAIACIVAALVITAIAAVRLW
ncbi:MAG TPA: succinate dehydrogenase, cytochrome b556 subunit [Casimicrobiaceae bacterium]|nr:succinate dehydrogenase, cytochrome b556 subunit [Casimicrobiaceae bacterium]